MLKVSIIECKSYNYDNLYDKIKEGISQLGRIEDFIKPDEKILIKPNLLGAHLPQKAITTHPEFVRVVVRLVKEFGAKPAIGDSPSVLNTEDVFNKTELKKIATEENVELINLGNSPVSEFEIEHPTVKKVYISAKCFEFDGIINLPKLKTHSLTTLTLSVKNLYGVVPGLLKSEYHREAPSTDSLSKLLAEIYRIIRPKIRLNIIDGIEGMDGEGPVGGRIRNFGLILLSEDAVALDTVIFNFFGIDLRMIPLIKYCKTLGVSDLEKISILNENYKRYKISDSILPKTHFVNLIPEQVARIARKFIWFKPKIKNSKCTLCMRCVEICPMKSIKKTYQKKLRIELKTCINCFCCAEVCAYSAIEIVESLAMKIARRII